MVIGIGVDRFRAKFKELKSDEEALSSFGLTTNPNLPDTIADEAGRDGRDLMQYVDALDSTPGTRNRVKQACMELLRERAKRRNKRRGEVYGIHDTRKSD